MKKLHADTSEATIVISRTQILEVHMLNGCESTNGTVNRRQHEKGMKHQRRHQAKVLNN